MGVPRQNIGRRQIYSYKQRPAGQQVCARYLEGDNISTKVGSGRVEIEIGMAYPDFPTNRDRVEITVLEFPGQNRGKSRFSSTFPAVFRSKTPGKVGVNLDFSRF